ncbi:hypothetical protein, partial [Roseibium sp.]|uniref:hypothetical protein n=1 Tax=Roseibium sp. TaxID=1936156 RepID=UPI003297B806
GLPTVRSHALADASHDGVVFSRTESLWTALPATTPESMPGIIRQVIAHPEVDLDEALERLAQALGQSPSIEFWTAVLTGLGLGTLDGQAERFMALLERHAVPRSLWFLASMYFDSSTTVPDLEGFEHVAVLQRAVDDFRNLEMPDYRADCLSILPADAVTPHCSSMEEATRFLAALAPIGRGEPISVELEPEFGEVETIELDQLTTLLSAASTLTPTLATQLVEHLGGEERLFDHFTKSTPWIDRPEIVDHEEHGRTVSTQWYRVSEDFQTDPHDTIVAICKSLVALSPRSNAAACRVVTPTGERYPMTEEASFEKCIPRENLPSPIRVAWNVAFRQLLLSRASVQRLTDYAASVANLFHRTERVFHKFSERWSSAKSIHGRDELAQEVNSIIESAQSLSHTTPNTRFSDMTSPLSDGAQDEPTASTISGILGNLLPRIAKLPGGGNERSSAMFAGDLSEQVSKLTDAPIWRTVEVPPRQALEGLRDQLAYVSAILHEMASDASSERVNALVTHAKQARTGNRCRLTALYARRTAEQRFDRILRKLEADLAAKGLVAECKTKPDLEPNSVFWPPAQLCVLLKVSNFEAFLTALVAVFEALDQTFPDGLVFRIAPLMNNQVIGTMGMLRVRDMPMASPDFAADWGPYLDHQLAPNTFTDRYQRCMNAMLSVSSIATCRDMDALHPDEEAVLSKGMDTTSDQMSALAEFIGPSSNDDAQEILAYMFQLSDRVSHELEDARRGDPPTEPICAVVFRHFDGIEDDDTQTFAAANLLASQILI